MVFANNPLNATDLSGYFSVSIGFSFGFDGNAQGGLNDSGWAFGFENEFERGNVQLVFDDSFNSTEANNAKLYFSSNNKDGSVGTNSEVASPDRDGFGPSGSRVNIFKDFTGGRVGAAIDQDVEDFVNDDIDKNEIGDRRNARAVGGAIGLAFVFPVLALEEVVAEVIGAPTSLSSISKKTMRLASKEGAQRSLFETTKAIARKKAGFSDKGIPVILDENISWKLAESLRNAGFNVRSVKEIFGRGGIKDVDINKLASQIGARVLTKDKGRQLDGGFFENAIRVNDKLNSADSLVRALKDGL